MSPQQTVAEVKLEIEKLAEDAPTSRQRLIYSGRLLKDDEQLQHVLRTLEVAQVVHCLLSKPSSKNQLAPPRRVPAASAAAAAAPAPSPPARPALAPCPAPAPTAALVPPMPPRASFPFPPMPPPLPPPPFRSGALQEQARQEWDAALLARQMRFLPQAVQMHSESTADIEAWWQEVYEWKMAIWGGTSHFRPPRSAADAFQHNRRAAVPMGGVGPGNDSVAASAAGAVAAAAAAPLVGLRAVDDGGMLAVEEAMRPQDSGARLSPPWDMHPLNAPGTAFGAGGSGVGGDGGSAAAAGASGTRSDGGAGAPIFPPHPLVATAATAPAAPPAAVGAGAAAAVPATAAPAAVEDVAAAPAPQGRWMELWALVDLKLFLKMALVVAMFSHGDEATMAKLSLVAALAYFVQTGMAAMFWNQVRANGAAAPVVDAAGAGAGAGAEAWAAAGGGAGDAVGAGGGRGFGQGGGRGFGGGLGVGAIAQGGGVVADMAYFAGSFLFSLCPPWRPARANPGAPVAVVVAAAAAGGGPDVPG